MLIFKKSINPRSPGPAFSADCWIAKNQAAPFDSLIQNINFRFAMEEHMKWKDTEEPNAGNEEPYEEINYGREYSSFGSGQKGGVIFRLFNRAEFPIVVLGLGLLVLIIIFFVYMPGFKKSTVQIDPAELKNRFKHLEDRLERLETSFAKNEKAGQPAAKVNQLDSKIRRMEKNIESSMNKMDTKLAEIKNRVAAIKPLMIAREETVKASGKHAGVRTHLVRAGETLYGISQQYGISVDILRGLNKLDAKTDIHPGQKLKIKTN